MEKSHRRALIFLVVLAAVLVALFVASVARRPDDRGPGGGCSPGEREAWQARLLRAQPVGPGQLAGCTTAPGVFTISGACALQIAAADARSRRLVVEALDPLELRRVTDADGRRIAMRVELEPGKDTQIFVGKDGDTVGLRCLSGLTCRARLR
jgi:hypothetical protein